MSKRCGVGGARGELAGVGEEDAVGTPHFAVLFDEAFGRDLAAEHDEAEVVVGHGRVGERCAEVDGEVDRRDPHRLREAGEDRRDPRVGERSDGEVIDRTPHLVGEADVAADHRDGRARERLPAERPPLLVALAHRRDVSGRRL